MTKAKLNLSAESALRVVLAGGFLLMLAASLPGHLSYDSVLELYEGHFHVRQSWAPAFYAWVLGVFDSVLPGTALYVVASGLLLFLALASFATLRGRVSWFAVPLALVFVLTPAVLVYQGIVWHDVLFANLAIAGMVCLSHAAICWETRARRWMFLAATLLLLAAAVLTRQNGFIMGVLAALALGWTAGAREGWKRGVAWGAGGFVALVLVAQALGYVGVPSRAGPADGLDKGLRILRQYDLIGALATDPNLPLPAIEAANPASARTLRREASRVYSAERVDFLDGQPGLSKALWSLSDKTVSAEWSNLILHHPGLYLRQRWQVFRWVFLTPVIDRCLPVYVGVDAPVEKMTPLGLVQRRSMTDQQLVNYSTWFMDTPAFSHLTYVVMGLLVAGVLLLRRDPADIPIVALTLGGVAFAASFFVISIACDYRYLYFLDLSAMAGLLYVVVDPRLRRS
jgi:hypothetical protein